MDLREAIKKSRARLEEGFCKDAEQRKANREALRAQRERRREKEKAAARSAKHQAKVEELKATLAANPPRHAGALRRDAELIERPAESVDLRRVKATLRQRRYRARKAPGKARHPAPEPASANPAPDPLFLIEIEGRLVDWVARNPTGARERWVKNRIPQIVGSSIALSSARERLGREPTLSEFALAIGHGATRMQSRRRRELLHRLEAAGGPLENLLKLAPPTTEEKRSVTSPANEWEPVGLEALFAELDELDRESKSRAPKGVELEVRERYSDISGVESFCLNQAGKFL